MSNTRTRRPSRPSQTTQRSLLAKRGRVFVPAQKVRTTTHAPRPSRSNRSVTL